VRALLSTFTVTTPADSGAGSLRQAILDANAALGTDEIDFNIAGAGVHTIAPASPLPIISDPVTIDGYTQPGASKNTLADGDNAVLKIALDGANAGVGANGLEISAGQSVVRGLAIGRFRTLPPSGIVHFDPGGSAIDLNTSDGNIIEGNFLGADARGTTARGNGSGGVYVRSSSNTIGGTTPDARNVLSGNAQSGVFIVDGSHNIVEGNFIGTDVSGTKPLGNSTGVSLTGFGGQFVFLSDNTVGGTTPAARNIISANQAGVSLSGSNKNVITGNFIGTDVTGANPLANAGMGISEFGTDTIGGITPGAGNVISGNGGVGIFFFGGSLAQGNFIGTDVTGAKALGNAGGGVDIEQISHVTIGGTATGAGNVISGNNGAGVVFSASTFNEIQGNLIGIDASGTNPLGNTGDGVLLRQASNNTVGGTTIGAGNVIAFNGRTGVSVAASSPQSNGIENAILGNTIFANTGLGIDLGADGVTPNTPGGPHAGPNHLQNFPVITSAVPSAGGTVIEGTLNSAPNTNFTIEFFASPTPDPSGFGQGKTFLGSTRVTTDSSGDASFTFNTVAVVVGQFLSATATDPNGNTSEFARDVAVVPPEISPTVVAVRRFGFHAQPTIVVLTFSEVLDPARAEDVHNYQIVTLGGHGRGGAHVGHVIAVRRAVYDPATRTVALYPSELLDIHNTYRLTVRGTPPTGITSASGAPLNGSGAPGTDFVGTIDRSTLAGTSRAFLRLDRRATLRNRGAKTLPRPHDHL
jgi:hypothetical protein